MSEPEVTLAKIELPVAKEDSARVVDAVLDIFAPVTELMGTLGDHVRLYRTRSVLKVAAETKKMADELGIKLKMPPLRFLIPFMEEASLHEETEEELTSLWANLLLQAGQDDATPSRITIDLLARLSPSDAVYFEKIVRNPRFVRSGFRQLEDRPFNFDRIEIRELIEAAIERSKDSEEDTIDFLIDGLEDRGIIITTCGFFGLDNGEIYSNHPDFPELEDLALHRLSNLGLVRYPLVYNRPYKGGVFSMTICVITNVGVDFYLSTHDPRVRAGEMVLPPYQPHADI